MKRWATSALLVFALNFGWEMTQGHWFASMQGLRFWHAVLLCLRATVGDVVIMGIAFTIAATTMKNATWPVGRRVVFATIVFIAVSVAITLAYEYLALSVGKWRYDARMPAFFGIGVLPLLQWLVLPFAEVMLFRLLWESEIGCALDMSTSEDANFIATRSLRGFSAAQTPSTFFHPAAPESQDMSVNG